jgi:ELWxxDGT repeat protein
MPIPLVRFDMTFATIRSTLVALIAVTVGFLLAVSPAQAQSPSVLADLNAGPDDALPSEFVQIDDNGTPVLIFAATGDNASGLGVGRELWKTDGTTAGTELIRDIESGVSNSSPGDLVVMNNVVYFVCTTSAAGRELCSSDGTFGGTSLLKDINPGSNDSQVRGLTVVGNQLFFFADNGTTGLELWVSDGTEVGTRLVQDIYPGSTPLNRASSGFNISLTGRFAGTNDTFYFMANDGTTGLELWKSDGTAGGTTLVRDIISGAQGPQYLQQFVGVGDLLVFESQETSFDREIFVSDGTASGTVQVDVNNSADGSSPQDITRVGDEVYFFASDASFTSGLYRFDPVNDISPQLVQDDLQPGFVDNAIAAFRGDVVFSNRSSSTGAYEIWFSDGGTASKIADARARFGSVRASGTGFEGDATPDAAGANLYFQAETSADGYELWRTDGTSAGTELVQNFGAGTDDANLTDLGVLNGTELLFGAEDATNGNELWRISESVGVPALQVSDATGPIQPGGTLDFGSTVVGVPVTVSLTLENDPGAGGELEITAATLSGPDAGAFDVVPRAPFPITLQPGRSTSVDVTLTAQTAGALRAQLAFESNDPNTPFTLTLSGRVGEVFVWPGDADNSGIANSGPGPDVTTDDLLPIGLCFGVEGPARPGGYDATWEEQPALTFGFPADTSDPCQVGAAGPAFTDPVFADATGDGRIDGRDVIPIGVNFGRSRTSASSATVASIVSSPSSRKPPVSRLRLPPPVRGSTYALSLHLDETPGDVFGISAQIRVPADTYEIASLNAGHGLHKEPSGGDLLSVHDYRPEDGLLRAAFSRKRGHGSARGRGPLLHIRLRALQTADEPAIVDLETATLSRAGDGLRQASSATLTSKDAVSSAEPASESFWVGAPSPHPARTQSSLTYRLPEAATVRIALFDALGRRVAELLNTQQDAGTQRLAIPASDLSSGHYFVRVTANGLVETRRLTVVR